MEKLQNISLIAFLEEKIKIYTQPVPKKHKFGGNSPLKIEITLYSDSFFFERHMFF